MPLELPYPSEPPFGQWYDVKGGNKALRAYWPLFDAAMRATKLWNEAAGSGKPASDVSDRLNALAGAVFTYRRVRSWRDELDAWITFRTEARSIRDHIADHYTSLARVTEVLALLEQVEAMATHAASLTQKRGQK